MGLIAVQVIVEVALRIHHGELERKDPEAIQGTCEVGLKFSDQ